jgi:hypothetical protein
VRFSTKEVQKHHNKIWGNPCQKLFFFLAEGKKNLLPVIFLLRFVLLRFWPVLCIRSSKT